MTSDNDPGNIGPSYHSRYRNFRTFTAPERTSTQFYSVALDYSGDIVCAGARDTFEIYVWSMKTGSLVNVSSFEDSISDLLLLLLFCLFK